MIPIRFRNSSIVKEEFTKLNETNKQHRLSDNWSSVETADLIE